MPDQRTKEEENIFQHRLRKTPIAIVGMSSVFPQSKNLDQYWNNILSEADCITEVPASRWNLDDYYDADSSVPDKTYSRKGGFIPDIDFDPMEFGLPPNILEVTDVSQLLALVMAKQVLKDGNYADASAEIRKRTGVILGVGGGQKLMTPLISRLQSPIWHRVLESAGINQEDRDKIVEKIKKAYVPWEENSFPGTLGNVISGRITNRLDLGGTNCVVDAACASSLSGIRMAVAELLDYRMDMMVTGGIDTDNSPYMYMCFSKTPAFTKNEKVQPFDENSSGIMIGEGIGMLLLKRLEDAERDGDNIYAVIRGIGSSSDGKFKSIYAPRSAGQQLALERAYEESGFEPASIGLLEAHGTGTKAGDLAEVSALKDFFGQHSSKRQHIAMGSVKSQMGHTKNAAGAASIIKVALALHHKVLPATINVTEPNSEFALEETPLYLNTETRPWIRAKDAVPRRAGVSAFGFGGTNFHFVLEEYQSELQEKSRQQPVAQQVILSGENTEQLLGEAKALLEGLKGEQAPLIFQEVCQGCRVQKTPQQVARMGFLAADYTEAVTALEKGIKKLGDNLEAESWNIPSGVYYRKEGMDPKGKVVALFSGQGSPYLNMGKDLVYNFPALMDTHAQMDQLFVDDQLEPLSRTVYPVPVFDRKAKKKQEAKLQLTENAQPSIGVFSAGQYRIFKEAGFEPDFTAGHSFGEVTALWAAGVYSDEDYVKLAKARGKAMAAPDDPNFDAGGMVAVVGKLKNLKKDLEPYPNVVMANFNSNKQVVVAGPKEDMKAVAADLKEKGYTTVLLGVSAAFHTPLVGHAQKPFAKVIAGVKFNKPNCPVYSNASGDAYPEDPKKIQEILKAHILNPVHFVQEIENIHQQGGYFFIEFGPQQILTKLLGNILRGKPYMAVALNASPKKPADRQFRDAVLQLRVAGLQLGDIDPYQRDPKVEIKKKSPLSMLLNGANYVSEKTKQAFEDALSDGFKVAQAKAPEPIVKTVIEKVIEKVYVPAEPTPVSPEPVMQPVQAQQTMDSQFMLESVERSLLGFQQQQHETLKVHEQFLANQAEYSKGFMSLMSQQSRMSVDGQGVAHPIPQEVTQSMMQFHQHQHETMRVHEQYLGHQTEYSRSSFEMVREQHQSLFPGTAVQVGLQSPVAAPLPKVQPVVPVQTRPVPVAAPQYRPVTAAPVAVAPVAVAPTQYKPITAPVAPVAVVPVPPVTVTPVAPVLDRAQVVSVLLDVVSEKTGYLKDMLELSMDIESDLGIDSIKRVEILHAVQEKLVDLPEVNPDDLSESRTLQEIAEQMFPAGASAKTMASAPLAAPAPVAAASGISRESVTQALLQVVSEKTGYLQDMLDLSMDLESDLGIDSIKRVEILHGIQEALEELPEVNPDDLSELRTLGQIVNQLLPAGSTTATVAETVAEVSVSQAAVMASSTGSISRETIQQALLEVVSEKTGYLKEMLDLSMDLESDLGIDSIKRVEILHGIQEVLEDLPEINPDDLSDLRTLGQIVDQMIPKAGQATGSLAVPEMEVAAQTDTGQLNKAAVTAALLEVVSEKTGYLKDMLDLSMDLESDLGIDSIKRVEILHGIQEKLPELPEINPDDLAELRTLEQIVDQMLPAGASAQTEEIGSTLLLNRDHVVKALLAVVSEKTGYPENMLDLNMDMESDLGIDSIKRVEILHGIQEKMPELPEINPDDLADLRTLDQIVTQMVQVAPISTGVEVQTVAGKKQ